MKRKQARKKVMNGFAPGPPIPIANPERPSMANSIAFWIFPGISLRFRVRRINGTITTTITIQLMMMEPVIDG